MELFRLIKFSIKFVIILLISVSCKQSFDEDTLMQESQNYGKFHQALTVFDESGINYIVYKVYSDDRTELDAYLASDFELHPVDKIQEEDVLESNYDSGDDEDLASGVTVVIDYTKFDNQFDEGYKIVVRPKLDDLRGWSNSIFVGPAYYTKFRVNRHTGWHNVYVSSWYTNTGNVTTGWIYNVPVQNNSAGYVRNEFFVYKWVVKIRYRKSSHYSYSFYAS